MALVEELATRFRLYADEEDDFSAVDDAEISLWLQDGYRAFLSLVNKIDPSIFTTSADYNPVANNVNLSTTAPIILGAGVLAASLRLLATTAVSIVDAAGDTTTVLRRAANRAELERWTGSDGATFAGGSAPRYFLQGSILLFSEDMSGNTIRVEYLGEPVVDWTKINLADAEFVETLGMFDDLVALLAINSYDVFTDSQSPAHTRLMEMRMNALRTHLYGRDEGTGYIIEVGDSY